MSICENSRCGWGSETPSDEDRASFCALIEHRLGELYPDAEIIAEVDPRALASRTIISGAVVADSDDVTSIVGTEIWNAWCGGERAPEDAPDGCDGYRVFRGRDSQQVRADGSALDPHAWYFEPEDYEGDVVFAAGFATRAEAVQGARNHVID